eukprot:1160775-Pelagomonas_calceolata.AAC.5
MAIANDMGQPNALNLRGCALTRHQNQYLLHVQSVNKVSVKRLKTCVPGGWCAEQSCDTWPACNRWLACSPETARAVQHACTYTYTNTPTYTHSHTHLLSCAVPRPSAPVLVSSA